MARSTFSTTAFAQLVRRLRYTNARYNQIAHQCRSKQRPTHHAKRRAYRAGLRIDTCKARACPMKYVSHTPLPVVEVGSPVDRTTMTRMMTRTRTRDFGLLDLPLRNLPDVVGPAPVCTRAPGPVIPVGLKQRRVDRRQRLTIRVPPLPLVLNYSYGHGHGHGHGHATPFQGPAPNAPLLKPRQLPEEDSDMEEISLGFSSSSSSFASTESVESLLTPLDLAYSGLCITAPPRSLKRKLQDVDHEEHMTEVSPSQPKRIMKARWRDSQTHERVHV